MNTFKNAEYTITTSISDQSAAIYIKVANNISYATYEGTFEKSAFRLSFELAGIYSLINKCFAAFTDCGGFKSAYTVTMELESSMMMRLVFNCMLEGIIAVEFDLRLQQKIVQGDAILSVELEKQNQLIERLIKRLDSAEKTIKLLDAKIARLEKLTKTVENIELEIQCMNEHNIARIDEIDKIERIIDCIGDGLYVRLRRDQLNGIGHGDECYLVNSNKLSLDCLPIQMLCNGGFHNFKYIINELEKIRAFYYLDDLTIKNDAYYPGNLFTIFNSSLRKLSIYQSDRCSDLAIIKQFPNLEELLIVSCGNLNTQEALHNLQSTPNKIKKITFQRVSNAIGLQSYCVKNGIELEFKD